MGSGVFSLSALAIDSRPTSLELEKIPTPSYPKKVKAVIKIEKRIVDDLSFFFVLFFVQVFRRLTNIFDPMITHHVLVGTCSLSLRVTQCHSVNVKASESLLVNKNKKKQIKKMFVWFLYHLFSKFPFIR